MTRGIVEKMFSSDNTVSYGRIISCACLACIVVWSSAIICRVFTATGMSIAELKSAIPDIPNNWLLVICLPFGISKIGETFQAWSKDTKAATIAVADETK